MRLHYCHAEWASIEMVITDTSTRFPSTFLVRNSPYTLTPKDASTIGINANPVPTEKAQAPALLIDKIRTYKKKKVQNIQQKLNSTHN